MRIYQAIADAVVAEGVETAYCLMGDANMMLVDDLVGRHGVRAVAARHENAAVAMADGAARASGRTAFATVTCGPGLTQATTALTAAARLRVPLVLFAGDTPADGRWNPQTFDLGTGILPTGALHVPLRSPARMAENIGAAFATARRDRRPVVLSMPYDRQEDPAPDGWAPRPSSRLTHRPAEQHPDPAAVAEAARLLATARRPVVVAGRGAVTAGARAAVLELAEHAGALLTTSLGAKDWFQGHDWDAGICGGLGTEAGRALVAEADVVVAIGTQLGYFGTDDLGLLRDATVVQLDLAPGHPVEGAAFGGLLIACDARRGTEALAAELVGVRPDTATGYRTEEVRQRLAAGAAETCTGPGPLADEPGRLDPSAAITALDAALSPLHQYVFGVGHFWSFAVMHTRRPDPRDYLYSFGFGSIGNALATAIGAATARDRPTVLVDGDGGLLMHVGELGTVAREGLDMLIVVMNDGGYGSEIHKLRAKGGDPELARFHDTDFAAVARGFGMEGHRVQTLDDLAAQVKRQRDLRGPMLVEVPMALSAVSAPTRRALARA